MKTTTRHILSFVSAALLVVLFSGCPAGLHEKNTKGDEKYLYPSEKAPKADNEEGIPTPGGASGGAAGSQSSSEKKSNPTNPDEPASR